MKLLNFLVLEYAWALPNNANLQEIGNFLFGQADSADDNSWLQTAFGPMLFGQIDSIKLPETFDKTIQDMLSENLDQVNESIDFFNQNLENIFLNLENTRSELDKQNFEDFMNNMDTNLANFLEMFNDSATDSPFGNLVTGLVDTIFGSNFSGEDMVDKIMNMVADLPELKNDLMEKFDVEKLVNKIQSEADLKNLGQNFVNSDLNCKMTYISAKLAKEVQQEQGSDDKNLENFVFSIEKFLSEKCESQLEQAGEMYSLQKLRTMRDGQAASFTPAQDSGNDQVGIQEDEGKNEPDNGIEQVVYSSVLLTLAILFQ